MKALILTVFAGLSVSAFATDAEPTAWNKYFCYYQDSYMNYKHAGGATTIGVAKGRALRECQEAMHRYGHNGGRCTFVGCKEIIRFESELFTPAE